MQRGPLALFHRFELTAAAPPRAARGSSALCSIRRYFFREARKATLEGVPNHARRLYAACLLSLDDAVGEIQRALATKHMWERTVLLVTSDNGAVPMMSVNAQARAVFF